jgi:3-oxoacyl-[acyl-carrier-protein] synthase II
MTAPAPGGVGAARAISLAINNAKLDPSEIDYICAHGTATPLNDVAETAAIKSALGEHAFKVPISSTKSMIGHLLGAAGAVSCVASVLAIRDNLVPPTINLETPDPECDLDYVPRTARKVRVDHSMVNAFGFGGQNAVVVFSRYDAA